MAHRHWSYRGKNANYPGPSTVSTKVLPFYATIFLVKFFVVTFFSPFTVSALDVALAIPTNKKKISDCTKKNGEENQKLGVCEKKNGEDTGGFSPSTTWGKSSPGGCLTKVYGENPRFHTKSLRTDHPPRFWVKKKPVLVAFFRHYELSKSHPTDHWSPSEIISTTPELSHISSGIEIIKPTRRESEIRFATSQWESGSFKDTMGGYECNYCLRIQRGFLRGAQTGTIQPYPQAAKRPTMSPPSLPFKLKVLTQKRPFLKVVVFSVLRMGWSGGKAGFWQEAFRTSSFFSPWSKGRNQEVRNPAKDEVAGFLTFRVGTFAAREPLNMSPLF